MTTTPALAQLAAQAKAINEKAEVEYDDVDGIGFARSATFDAETSKALHKALKVINDERIEKMRLGKDKRLKVTVVSDTRADYRTPFPIEEVNSVLDE